MKKKNMFMLFCGYLLLGFCGVVSRDKVLHITFHNGCKQDFEDVAQELNLDLTTWYVQGLPKDFWEGFSAGNEIYNVGPTRAKRIWDRHKEYFDQFDIIVTSDTVPLSRIFLQNGWSKPLIIWVCNRFDYAHPTYGIEERFPDRAYYDLMRDATKKTNVRFISYTPYEHVYAKQRGVDIGVHTIKPIGKKELPRIISHADTSEKNETLLLFPCLELDRINRTMNECKARDISVWTGTYDGPEDLKQYKGVLFFPYAFSNLALFENLQRGIVHFVPTIRFLTQLGFIRRGMRGNLEWSEWYLEEYKDVIVYFDSWDDLKYKVESTHYVEIKQKIKNFGQKHRQKMIQEWDTLFQELIKTSIHKDL